jgi:hypothetical protein
MKLLYFERVQLLFPCFVSPCMQCCLTSRRTAACLPVSLSTHLLHLGLLMWLFAIYCGGFPPSFSFCPEKCLNAAGWWSSDGSRILSYLSPLLHNVLSSVMWSPTSLNCYGNESHRLYDLQAVVAVIEWKYILLSCLVLEIWCWAYLVW